jgi:hypothetical protein
VLARRASPYFVSESGVVNGPLQDVSFLVGAGSAYSTPRDLFLFLRAVVDGGLGPVVPLALLKEAGVEWNGVTNGFRAFVRYDKASGVTVAFAGNLLTGATDLLRRDVIRLATGKSVEIPERLDVSYASVDPEALRRCEGSYADQRAPR